MTGTLQKVESTEQGIKLSVLLTDAGQLGEAGALLKKQVSIRSADGAEPEPREVILGEMKVRLEGILRQLEAALDHRCELPESIQQALNSGDGVYRP